MRCETLNPDCLVLREKAQFTHIRPAYIIHIKMHGTLFFMVKAVLSPNHRSAFSLLLKMPSISAQTQYSTNLNGTGMGVALYEPKSFWPEIFEFRVGDVAYFD